MFKLLMVFIIGMGVGAVLCAAVTVCILDRYASLYERRCNDD